jgi:hypothetical protein
MILGNRIYPEAPMRRITACLTLAAFLFLVAVGPARAFSDVPPEDPAYRATAELRLKNALDGYLDGTYRPNAATLRAEFAKMLVRVLFLPVDASAPPSYPDLGPSSAADAFPNGFIAAARDAGLMRGTAAGLADPYGALTRGQAASMLVRAARSVPGGLKPVPPGFSGASAGITDPAHGFDSQIAEVNGLLAHLDLSSWNPWASVSRGEAADLVANLLTCFA